MSNCVDREVEKLEADFELDLISKEEFTVAMQNIRKRRMEESHEIEAQAIKDAMG